MTKDFTDLHRTPGRARSRRALLAGAALTLALLVSSTGAQAGAVLQLGQESSLSVGFGMRASFSAIGNAAPDGSTSKEFNLDSARLYLSGSINRWLKATFNTERDSSGHVNVLDGYAQLEPLDQFNVWLGRMLPPSDRANLDGPYYLNTWQYPSVASQYPAKFAGRDDGATVWGKAFDKKLVYAFGVFNGHNRVAGASNHGDNPLLAGRVSYNFWDAEPDPAYYTSSTYYGAANVLTLAVAGMQQSDGVGTAARRGDYTAWNVDGLFERKYPFGVVTLEGAYYQYHTDGVADVSPGFNGADSTDNVGGIAEGNAYLLGGAYMFPGKLLVGYVQPSLRYQHFDNHLTSESTSQYDVALNYVISGHNARITADYFHKAVTAQQDTNGFILGTQLQF